MSNKGQDGVSVSAAGSSKHYEDMTIPQLKDELKQRKLKMTGNKPELVERLKRRDRDDDNDDVESSRNDDENYDDMNETVMDTLMRETNTKTRIGR